MADKNLFSGKVFNEAGGTAYNMKPALTLAIYANTGCLSNTFYADAETQLETVLSLCRKVEPERVAKTAVYSREKGNMKDMPALLCAHLASIGRGDLLAQIWDRVIDNGRMLRNFVQIIRSGKTGRRSFGSLPKRLIADWFNCRTAKEIFNQSVGNNPSFCDIIRIAHPRPLDDSKNALYRWILGKEYKEEDLPVILRQFEDFKAKRTREVPHVPFDMLTALELTQSDWCQIAMRAGWQWLRMNLNTLSRHKVFDIPEMVEMVASRLQDRDAILKARVFPYQIMAAYKHTSMIPASIRTSLGIALDVATENVPTLPGKGYVFLDISGSMKHPVTGMRKKVSYSRQVLNKYSSSAFLRGNSDGGTSVMRCVDVASLVVSSLLRKNPDSIVIPFEKKVREHSINPKDSVLTNADKLSNMASGDTRCSAPMEYLNEKKAKGDWIFLVSDNQSWLESLGTTRYGNVLESGTKTKLMEQWELFKVRNPHARMVCLDIQPYATTQAQERPDVLNCGGFSDNIFTVVSTFLRGELVPEHWLGVIDEVELGNGATNRA